MNYGIVLEKIKTDGDKGFYLVVPDSQLERCKRFLERQGVFFDFFGMDCVIKVRERPGLIDMIFRNKKAKSYWPKDGCEEFIDSDWPADRDHLDTVHGVIGNTQKIVDDFMEANV